MTDKASDVRDWRQKVGEIGPRLARTGRQLRRVLALLWRVNARAVLLLVAQALVKGLVPIAQLWIGKLIIDQLTGIFAARIAVAPLPDTTPLVWLVVAELAVSILNPAIDTLQQMVETLLGQQVVFTITEQIMETAATLDLAFFERAEFYDKLQLASSEASYRPVNMLAFTLSFISSVITFVSLLGLLLFISPLVIVVLLLLALPSLFVQFNYIEQAFFLSRHQTPEARRMSYDQMLLTNATGIKEIKLFGLGDYFLDEYRALFRQIQAETAALLRKRVLRSLATTVLSVLGYVGIYAYLIAQAVAGRLTIGDLTAFTGAVVQAQGTFSAIIGTIAHIYEGGRYLDNLFDFLALKPAMPVAPPAQATPTPPMPQTGIRFENVSFGYPDKERAVLDDVNITIRPGETIALVGENGAGKTTLIKLLCRLYDPTAGRITLDGTDLRDFDPAALREMIGVIFQDYARYYLSAADNIGLGRLAERENMPRIRNAARLSGADEVIRGLPQGYAAMLGVYFDEGAELSGGQWQRIALARAFMRDAQIVILDEPTAALDARAEAEVFQKFRDLSQGKMTILISHRFSTVRAADRIYVLEGGRVTETGSHAELLARGGHYAELFTLQAAGYQ